MTKKKAVGKGPSGTTIAVFAGVGLLAVYALTKKPATTPYYPYPGTNPPPNSTAGIINAGSGLLSQLMNLFGSSSSAPSAPNASSGSTPVSNSPYGQYV